LSSPSSLASLGGKALIKRERDLFVSHNRTDLCISITLLHHYTHTHTHMYVFADGCAGRGCDARANLCSFDLV